MSAEAPLSNYAAVYQYFEFYPSKGPIIVAMALFSLATLIVLLSTVYTRQWYMLIAVVVGGLELAGYGCRWSMLSNPGYGSYVAMNCFLVISPTFLALCEYLTLGKVVEAARRGNPEIRDFLKPGLIKWAYFVAELCSLGLQGAGVGISVSVEGVNENLNTGRILLLVGLACIVAIIVAFLINAVYLCLRPEYGVWRSRHLRRLFTVLFITTTLLTIRNVFRLVEFAVGFYGAISRREKFFYWLDALPIVILLYIFGFFNFGFFLKAYNREIDAKGQSLPAPVEQV